MEFIKNVHNGWVPNFSVSMLEYVIVRVALNIGGRGVHYIGN